MKSRHPLRTVASHFDHLVGEMGQLSGVVNRIRIDVEEADDEYVVTADVPGFDADELSVELIKHNRVLHITADHAESFEDDPSGDEMEVVWKERHAQTFERHIPLPQAVDADAVSAQYTNGVLTITLPKNGGDHESVMIPVEE